MNALVSTPLTDPEIDILVGRYIDAMARYEETARLVEDRLRRALRAKYVTWLLDRSVERLLVERAKAVQRQTVPLKDPEELQFALEQGVGRRLHGEFVRLYRLLGAVIQPFTPAALGSVHDLLQRGEQRAHELKIQDADDVVYVTLAMFDDYADEFEQLVREQRGPATLLKKAVLLAAEERRSRA